MSAWEMELARKFEEDLKRLTDYAEIDIQFREWQLELFKDLYVMHFILEEENDIEPDESDPVDDSMRDHWICDGECVWTEQSQVDDQQSAEGDLGDDEEGDGEWTEAESLIEDDLYEEEYDKIDRYKNSVRTRKKKARYKRKK